MDAGSKRERDPICDVCGHCHVQGVKCAICGHIGKYIGARGSGPTLAKRLTLTCSGWQFLEDQIGRTAVRSRRCRQDRCMRQTSRSQRSTA